ncbi:MAG: glycosyltransferase [Leptolyngbyaceae cyanobacterium bins.302]|nr:glycosyltransferase [Leptolyngbyaceae cyanobacterium bins.302]
MSERVTWLLPIKNGMPYLPQTLASIAAQTYSNWEILAWDNGSTDGTIAELHQWIPSRLPGRVVTDHPLSLGNALAEMVKQAQTELCARIDADDVNLPQRLEKQVEFLQHHPEVAVLGSQVHRIDSQGIDHGLWTVYPLQPNDILHFMLRSCVIWHPTVLFRRSRILAAGNYRDIPSAEDYDLWLRVAIHDRLANLNESLVQYRVHDQSVTQTTAIKTGLASISNQCFCRNAKALYGCSEQDALLLRERRHPQPIRVLKDIAQYLQQTQPGGDRLQMESFMQAGRQLISSKDPRSCLIWAALNRDKFAVPQELFALARSSFKVLGTQAFNV